MRVMIIVKATRESEAGIIPDSTEFEAMGAFNEELVNKGIMLAGEGLHPSSEAMRVHFSREKATVTHGPFPEKEVVAGFWLWDVASLDEALEWVKRVPNTAGTEYVIEIRQVFETEDFGEAFTPELRAQEDLLRERIAGKKLRVIL